MTKNIRAYAFFYFFLYINLEHCEFYDYLCQNNSLIMLTDLLNSAYFALFLIVALGFMLGRIKVRGVSLDVSAVIFIALLFGHFGVSIPKELGNFGLVLFIFTIGIQAGPGFFDSFRSKGKTLILITLLIIA